MTVTGTARPLAALAALLLSTACIVSPIPQPPNVDPPELDLELVETTPCGACDEMGVEIKGGAGAVLHPGGDGPLSLWAVNLDGTEPPQTTPVEADGSFEVGFIRGETSHHYRLQPRSDELRGAPVDVTFTPDRAEIVEVVHPLVRCFSTDPELDFGEAEAGDLLPLELRNLCAEPIEIESVTLRAPTESFRFEETPTTIPAFGSASFGVEFTGPLSGAGPLQEAILLVEVRGEARDRRAVTLIASGR